MTFQGYEFLSHCLFELFGGGESDNLLYKTEEW